MMIYSLILPILFILASSSNHAGILSSQGVHIFPSTSISKPHTITSTQIKSQICTVTVTRNSPTLNSKSCHTPSQLLTSNDVILLSTTSSTKYTIKEVRNNLVTLHSLYSFPTADNVQLSIVTSFGPGVAFTAEKSELGETLAHIDTVVYDHDGVTKNATFELSIYDFTSKKKGIGLSLTSEVVSIDVGEVTAPNNLLIAPRNNLTLGSPFFVGSVLEIQNGSMFVEAANGVTIGGPITSINSQIVDLMDSTIMSSSANNVTIKSDSLVLEEKYGGGGGGMLTSSRLNVTSPKLFLHSNETIILDAKRVLLSAQSSFEPSTHFLANSTATYLYDIVYTDIGTRVRSGVEGVDGGAILVLEAVENNADAVLNIVSTASGESKVVFSDSDGGKTRTGVVSFNYDEGKEMNMLEFGFEHGSNKEPIMRLTGDGKMGVGSHVSHGKLRAPVHIRNSEFTSKIADTPSSIGLIIEGKSNTIQLSGEQSGGIRAVNNIVMASTPILGGFSEYWVMSQRGPSDGVFLANSLIFAHTAEPRDINNNGLDELRYVKNPTLTLTEDGNTCIGCAVKSTSRLTVGGSIDSTSLNLVSDSELLKSRTKLPPNKALNILKQITAYDCEYVDKNNAHNKWRQAGHDLGSNSDYCLIGQNVESADAKLVKLDKENIRLVRVKSLLSLIVAGVNDLEKRVERGEEEWGAKGLGGAVERGEVKLEKVAGDVEELVNKRIKGLDIDVKWLKEGEGGVVKLEEKIRKLEREVGVLEAENVKREELLKVYMKQVEGLVASLEKLSLGTVRSENGNEDLDGGGDGGETDDLNFFLEEIARLEREFVGSSGTGKVTDSQLEVLRGKWRTQAHVSLLRRKGDKEFYNSRNKK